MSAARVALVAAALCSACRGEAPGGGIEQLGPGRIAFSERLRIGDATGPGAIGRPAAVTADAHGSFWVVSEESNSSVTVFDSLGTFARTIGRAGEGPGEFAAINEFVPMSRSVLVFDIRNQRVTELALAGGELLRTHPLGMSVSRAKAGPEGLILVAGFSRADSMVIPMAILDAATLDVVSTTGAEPPGLRYEFYAASRFAAWTAAGDVVSLPPLAYTVETWSTTGALLDRWAREPEWMPPQTIPINMTRERQQHPMVVDAHVDAEGRLWTMIRVNPPDWHLGLGTAMTTPDGEEVVRIDDINQVFGTRIEVLDVPGRRVLASIYTPDLFVNFLPDGRAVSYVEDVRAPTLVVWDLALEAGAPGSD